MNKAMNTCTLYKNGKKKNERSPSCTGKICVDNKWYWVSGWTGSHTPFGSDVVEKTLGLKLTEMTKDEVNKYIHKIVDKYAGMSDSEIATQIAHEVAGTPDHYGNEPL